MGLKKWFLKREFARTARLSGFKSWNEIRSVLVLFDSDVLEKNSAVNAFVKKMEAEGKLVTTCCFVDKKRSEISENDTRIVLDRSSLNIIGRPKNRHLLGTKEFDVVIDLTLEQTLALQYVLLWAHTSLRCGKKKECEIQCDFLIDLPERADDHVDKDPDEVRLGEQVIRYLKQFRSV